jgi:hypothetical protein
VTTPVYILAVVYRDGNPVDVQEFGPDQTAALEELHQRRLNENPYWEHWMVYDGDDPERGYFDPE